MQRGTFRYHGTKVVDYAIRALFVCVVVIPLLFFLSMSGGLGTEPPEHGEVFFGHILLVAVAPADYAIRLLAMIGISSGLVAWLVGFIIVPLFWGAFAYGTAQLCRRFASMARQRLTKRCSERLPGVRPRFSMIKPLHLRSTLAPGRRR